MGKYIIEVGDAYAEYICGKGKMLCLPVRINEFEDNWLNTNIPLTPYTEPDTEKVRKEAYGKGFEDGREYCPGQLGCMDATYQKGFRDGTKQCVNCEDFKENAKAEAYQKGLSDAWEAARKTVISEGFTCREMQRIFCTDEVDEIFNMSASEAIERIRQYEQEQEAIQVGDEVRNIKGGWIAVVSNIDGECMTLMDTNGALGDGYDVNRFTKTGRHFPEIAAVLEKMRGEKDG